MNESVPRMEELPGNLKDEAKSLNANDHLTWQGIEQGQGDRHIAWM